MEDLYTMSEISGLALHFMARRTQALVVLIGI